MAHPSNERHLLIVNGEHAEEFSHWLRDVHIPEVVAHVGSFKAGQHFQLSETQPVNTGTGLKRYLTVFEIEGSPTDALRALDEARSAGTFQSPPAEGRGETTTALFEPVIVKVTRPDPDASSETG